MKNILLCLLKAFCYALSFVLLQSCAGIFIVAAYLLLLYAEQFRTQGTLPRFDALLESASLFLRENAALLAGLGDLFAVLVLWLFFRLRKKSLAQEAGLLPPGPGERRWPAALCGAAFALALSFAVALLPRSAMLEAYAEASGALVSGNLAVIFVCVVLVGPFCEEIFFRGLVYTRLCRAMPKWLAAVLSSAAFALIHGGVIWILYAFFAGLAMAYIRERAGLGRSVLFHVFFNFAGSFLVGFFSALSAPWMLALCIACLSLGLWMLRCVGMDAKKREKEEKLA